LTALVISASGRRKITDGMTGMMIGTSLMIVTETGRDSDNPLNTINRSAFA